MTTIRVYEPALCCNTGVCGEDVDPALVAFSADLAALRELGVDIERHNLANDPAAFANDDTVRGFLQVAGSEGLPLTVVDGVTVATGEYPSRERLMAFAQPAAATVPAAAELPLLAGSDAGCCGSDSAGACGCGSAGAGSCGCGSGDGSASSRCC
jgi:arsenite-transporting ATPase